MDVTSLPAAKVNVSFNVMISLTSEPLLTTAYIVVSKTLIFKAKTYTGRYIGLTLNLILRCKKQLFLHT